MTEDEPIVSAYHSRILELDGFRAAAVLMVLVHHLFYGWPLGGGTTLPWLPHALAIAIQHGWLGVDLFFILSGFLITGILLDSKEGQHYFRNFYTRRILRIAPLYLACILVMYFVYSGYRSYLGLSLLFLANFMHYFRVQAPHGPAVFWSLAVEEHFYVLWPLLVRILTRASLFVLALVLVFGTPILRGVCAHAGMDPAQIYTYSFFRFDGLALGALLALWVRSRHYSRSSAWKLAGFLIGFSLLVTLMRWPYGIMNAKVIESAALRYTQAQFVFAGAMALAIAYRGSVFTGLLRSRFARLTADLSYCIYLIHLSLGDGYYWILHRIGFGDVEHFGAVGALAVRSVVIGGLTFGLAALSKRFLEDPFLRLKRFF